MQTPKTQRFLLFVLLAIPLTTAMLILSSGSNRAATPLNQEQTKNSQIEDPKRPVAVFTASKPTDPREQALRYARSSRYDHSYPTPLDQLRPDTVEESRISHFWLNMPALPTTESDAVVLGEVINASAYVSNDKTGAYSEYTVRIEKIFKDDGRLSNGLVIAEREGADVQLPGGRILRYRVADQGAPSTGRNYILFLKYDDQAKDYHILTGYKLHKGHVSPLDGSIGRFAYYKDFDESILLEAVREAVLHPPQAPQDTKRDNR